MVDSSHPLREQLWKWVLPVAFVYGGANLLALPLLRLMTQGSQEWEQIIWRNLTIGFIASQVWVIARALAFAPGTFVRRLVLWWSIAFGLWACWAIGYAIYRRPISSRLFYMEWEHLAQYLLPITFSLPLVTVIAQLPLWAFRFCFGWRWEFARGPSTAFALRWSLSDLLAGTACVALSLALFRASGVPLDASFWEAPTFMMVYTAVIDLICVVPVMVIALGRFSWWMITLLTVVHAALVALAALGLQVAMSPGSAHQLRNDPLFECLAIMPPTLAFVAGLHLAIFTARASGLRLVMGHLNRQMLER